MSHQTCYFLCLPIERPQKHSNGNRIKELFAKWLISDRTSPVSYVSSQSGGAGSRPSDRQTAAVFPRVNCYRGGRKKSPWKTHWQIQYAAFCLPDLLWRAAIWRSTITSGGSDGACGWVCARVYVIYKRTLVDVFFPILNWIIERILVQSSSVFISTSNFLWRDAMAVMFISAPSTAPSTSFLFRWTLLFFICTVPVKSLHTQVQCTSCHSRD